MIRLRPAEPQDSWAAYQLRKQIQPDLQLAAHDHWWTDTWEHRFMAYDGPVLVGIIRLSQEGVIHLLVAEKERGKGLGTQMLQAIKRVAKELGFAQLQARVEPANIASQRAFLGAGYRPTQFEVIL